MLKLQDLAFRIDCFWPTSKSKTTSLVIFGSEPSTRCRQTQITSKVLAGNKETLLDTNFTLSNNNSRPHSSSTDSKSFKSRFKIPSRPVHLRYSSTTSTPECPIWITLLVLFPILFQSQRQVLERSSHSSILMDRIRWQTLKLPTAVQIFQCTSPWTTCSSFGERRQALTSTTTSLVSISWSSSPVSSISRHQTSPQILQKTETYKWLKSSELSHTSQWRIKNYLTITTKLHQVPFIWLIL